MQVDVLLELLVLVAGSLGGVVHHWLPLVRPELEGEEHPAADLVELILVDALGHVDVGELEHLLVEPLLLVGLEVHILPSWLF